MRKAKIEDVELIDEDTGEPVIVKVRQMNGMDAIGLQAEFGKRGVSPEMMRDMDPRILAQIEGEFLIPRCLVSEDVTIDDLSDEDIAKILTVILKPLMDKAEGAKLAQTFREGGDAVGNNGDGEAGE